MSNVCRRRTLNSQKPSGVSIGQPWRSAAVRSRRFTDPDLGQMRAIFVHDALDHLYFFLEEIHESRIRKVVDGSIATIKRVRVPRGRVRGITAGFQESENQIIQRKKKINVFSPMSCGLPLKLFYSHNQNVIQLQNILLVKLFDFSYPFKKSSAPWPITPPFWMSP